VIISPKVEWVDAKAPQSTRDDLRRVLEQWRSDWESLDTDRYLRHYSGQFSAGRQNLAAWSQQKRSVNANKTWIKVKVDRVSMFLYPGNNDLVVVSFEQQYSSNNLSNQMRKRQYWQREGGNWRIIHEGAS
jgi:murein L,D-transpeptidase YafK